MLLSSLNYFFPPLNSPRDVEHAHVWTRMRRRGQSLGTRLRYLASLSNVAQVQAQGLGAQTSSASRDVFSQRLRLCLWDVRVLVAEERLQNSVYV